MYKLWSVGNSRSGTIGYVLNEYINNNLYPNKADYNSFINEYMNYVQLTPVIKILLEREIKKIKNV